MKNQLAHLLQRQKVVYWIKRFGGGYLVVEFAVDGAEISNIN